MNRRETGITLVVLGVVLVALEIGSAPAEPTTAIIRTGPFLLIATAVSFMGGVIIRDDESIGEYGTEILTWTVGSATTFAAIGYLITLGLPVDRFAGGLPISVLEAFTAGSLVGIVVGVYDARSRLRFDALQTERDRVERFARKAKSLNAYGKALNESRDVHGVSALSIEVLEFLIGSNESAVVAVGDMTTVLDSTLPEPRHDFVVSVANEVAAGSPMDTVRCPGDVDCSIPEDLAGTELLGVPIDANDVTIVLLALVRSNDAYTEEDLDLLESLSAHVGTAVPNLDRGVEQEVS
ncbi:GAF domain-containing protein [Halodesulfurarchaeum sp.]|uniref:GAF domain-containing protein n=1 Tax=Halodesulfurarchaeum sp. TaxID=1980530 RepID=UPI002FC32371